MEFPKELMKGMNGSRWQGMLPLINVTFKGEEENNRRQFVIIDLIKLTKFNKIINVPGYGCSIITIKH